MNVKTLTGTTIRAALAEARRLFGEDVVLLEAVPPSDTAPARVTVMADVPATSATPPAPKAKPRTPTQASPPLVPFGYGGGATRPTTRQTAPAPAPVPAPRSRAAGKAAGSKQTPVPVAASVPAPAAAQRRLFQAPGPAQAAPAGPDPMQKLFESQLRLLHQRMDRLESKLETPLVDASHAWIANPAFGELLKQGVRPATAKRWFDRIAEKGVEPGNRPEEIKWALAQEIRRSIAGAAARKPAGSLLFMGPGGTGKTSLILKLAKHPQFYGRRNAAVVVLHPEGFDDTGYENPAERYKRFGITALTVTRPEEMEGALHRLQRFDQVFVDTPSLPVDEASARKLTTTFRRMTDVVLPLHVVFVADATRSLDDFQTAYLATLPLKPDSVAITRLDEVSGWGRIAEWILKLKMPVSYASTGARVPDGVVAFSPAWFVEEMLNLQAL